MKNTTLCYITQGNQVLMLHRVKKENDLNHDKWIGVGGKCEEGESPEECLLREGEYMHLFQADGFTGQLCQCPEGDLAWVSRDFLERLPKWEGDRIFLNLMWRRAPFFSLKLSYEGDRLCYAALDGKPLRQP